MKNSMFFGACGCAMLDRLEIGMTRSSRKKRCAPTACADPDVRIGPDGAVYVLTDSGTPTMIPNTPQTSKF